MLVLEHGAVGPGDVGIRDFLQRQRQGLDDEIVDRELVGGLAVLVFRRRRIDVFACGEQRVERAVEREIEMRDGLFRLGQPPRDDAAAKVARVP